MNQLFYHQVLLAFNFLNKNIKKHFLNKSYGVVQVDVELATLIKNCSGTPLMGTVSFTVLKSSTISAAAYQPVRFTISETKLKRVYKLYQ